eukprot:m.268536 g.268536  ORF g.268536 m.268536 type:complete len:103 (-) comp26811_c0_seq1:264-572(-)
MLRGMAANPDTGSSGFHTSGARFTMLTCTGSRPDCNLVDEHAMVASLGVRRKTATACPRKDGGEHDAMRTKKGGSGKSLGPVNTVHDKRWGDWRFEEKTVGW